VKLPYITCETAFDANRAQAVYATVVNGTEEEQFDALCVVDAPAYTEDETIVDATIQVSQSRGPRAKPEIVRSTKVRFAQSPVVVTGYVLYGAPLRYGSVVVALSRMEGLVEVRSYSSPCSLWWP
jgi:hypothetical protein